MFKITMFFIIATFAGASCDSWKGDKGQQAKKLLAEPRVILTGIPQPALNEEGASFDDRVNRASICGVKVIWNYTQGYAEFRNRSEYPVRVEYESDRKNGDGDVNLPPSGSARLASVAFKNGDEVTIKVKPGRVGSHLCRGTFALGRTFQP